MSESHQSHTPAGFVKQMKTRNTIILAFFLTVSIIVTVKIVQDVGKPQPDDDPAVYQRKVKQMTKKLELQTQHLERNADLIYYSIIGLLGIVAASGLIISCAQAAGLIMQHNIVEQQIGQSILRVHRKLAKSDKIMLNLERLTAAEGVAAVSQAEAVQMYKQINADLQQYTRAVVRGRSQQPVLMPAHSQPAVPSAGPQSPSFRELLLNGDIGQGKPLIFGFGQDGQSRSGHWFDLFSSAIGGQSRQGKTATLRNLITQSLLSGAVEMIWVVDYHYPHPDSLLASLGQIKDLPQVKYAENRFDTLRILEEVDAGINRRLQNEEASNTVKVLVIDEVFALCEVLPAIPKIIKRIGTESSKCSIYGLFSAQTWKASNVGGSEVRDNLTSRIAHKMQPKQANLLLQDSDQAKAVKNLSRGQVLFCPVNSEPEVLSVPYCAPADMAPVYERLVSNGDVTPSRNVVDLAARRRPAEPVQAAEPVVKPDDDARELVLTMLDQQCDNRSEAQSKNDWQRHCADRAGMSFSLLKNIMAGNVRMTDEALHKLQKVLSENA